jgi:hypothetical protein
MSYSLGMAADTIADLADPALEPAKALAEHSAANTGRPVGLIQLETAAVIYWAMPSVEGHETAAIHPDGLHSLTQACARLLDGEDGVEFHIQMKPVGPEVTVGWLPATVRLAKAPGPSTLPLALLRVTGPCSQFPGEPHLSV